MKKCMFALAIFLMFAAIASAEPYFSISSLDDWEAPETLQQISPLEPPEWEDYMQQWELYRDPQTEPYPTDNTDPEQNWYIISADWSSPTPDPIPYCTVLHLGLEFKVVCHNVIIDLVGWWTSDGQKVQAGANGGYIPIPGFNVQDQVQPQQIRIQNGNNNGEPEPGEIPMEIMEMQLAAVTPMELYEILGSEPFKELRLGGRERNLPAGSRSSRFAPMAEIPFRSMASAISSLTVSLTFSLKLTSQAVRLHWPPAIFL